MLFASVRRAPSRNSIIYATVKEPIIKHCKGSGASQNHVYGTTYCNTLSIQIRVHEHETTSSIYHRSIRLNISQNHFY